MLKSLSAKYIKKSLSSAEYGVVMQCSDIADEFGVKIYLIGGIVRDLLLGCPIKDIDITVEGSAEEFVKFLKKKTKPKFVKFNQNLPTAKVKFANNVEIDFASTRKESYPVQGELPVIEETGTSLRDDVLRRDFTVNSIALSLNKDDFLSLIDYTGGIDDLKNKKIRVLHDKSFYDDPSRIIRGLKFSQRYSFTLEKHTLELQNEYLSNPLKNIPLKRVKDEITETFSTAKFAPYDEFIRQNLYKIFRDGTPIQMFGEKIHELIFDFEIKEEDYPLLYFLPLLFQSEIPEKFNLSAREISIINEINKICRKNTDFDSELQIKEYFDTKDYLVCVFYGLLKDKEISKKYFSKLSKINLLINGSDLKLLGVTVGKIYGELLKKVLAYKIEYGLKTKEDELNYLKSLL